MAKYIIRGGEYYGTVDDVVDSIEALEAEVDRLRMALTIDPWLLGYTGWKMHVDETLAAYRSATGGET